MTMLNPPNRPDLSSISSFVSVFTSALPIILSNVINGKMTGRPFLSTPVRKCASSWRFLYCLYIRADSLDHIISSNSSKPARLTIRPRIPNLTSRLTMPSNRAEALSLSIPEVHRNSWDSRSSTCDQRSNPLPTAINSSLSAGISNGRSSQRRSATRARSRSRVQPDRRQLGAHAAQAARAASHWGEAR
jgi:hypothetical protein